EARDARHLDLEDHVLGMDALREMDRFAAVVGRVRLDAVAVEQHRHGIRAIAVAVGNENRLGHCSHASPTLRTRLFSRLLCAFAACGALTTSVRTGQEQISGGWKGREPPRPKGKSGGESGIRTHVTVEP